MQCKNCDRPLKEGEYVFCTYCQNEIKFGENYFKKKDYKESEEFRTCKKCNKNLPIERFYIIKYNFTNKVIYRRKTCKLCICNIYKERRENKNGL